MEKKPISRLGQIMGQGGITARSSKSNTENPPSVFQRVVVLTGKIRQRSKTNSEARDKRTARRRAKNAMGRRSRQINRQLAPA